MFGQIADMVNVQGGASNAAEPNRAEEERKTNEQVCHLMRIYEVQMHRT